MADRLALLSYGLTTLCFALSLSILALTALLSSWTGRSPSSYPLISVSSDPTGSTQEYSILAYPARYNSYGVVLNIIPGAGGLCDSLLLFICFFSIDYIYLARRTNLAKAARTSAAQGKAPVWLWGVTIFIIAFSVARSLVGFVGATVGYYSSATFSLPSSGNVQVDGDNRYIAPDGKGFSVGGWVCQVNGYVLLGDAYKGQLNSLCSQEQAARWMTLPLLFTFSALLFVVVFRFRSEKRRVSAGRQMDKEDENVNANGN